MNFNGELVSLIILFCVYCAVGLCVFIATQIKESFKMADKLQE